MNIITSLQGDLVKSPVTGRLEPEYPAWKRNIFRYFISVPVIALCLGVVLITMLWNFQLQDWVNSLIKDGHLPFFFKYFPKILLALCIGLLDDIYKKVAFWLNDKGKQFDRPAFPYILHLTSMVCYLIQNY